MNPPHESRPMALWHWMNGNVTKDGIKKDLQWMHDIGLSGFFLFDAAYSTPQVVDTLLPYMSEGWKDAFRYAVALADSLDLEVGIGHNSKVVVIVKILNLRYQFEFVWRFL